MFRKVPLLFSQLSSSAFWEKVFLAGLILTAFLSIRKTIATIAPLPGASFNEYADISLYAFDVFFILWASCFILRNKILILSILRSLYKQKSQMFHVEHFPLSALIIVFFLSTLFSKYPILSFYTLHFWLQGIFLFTALLIYPMFHVEHLKNSSKNVPRGTFEKLIKKCSTWNILQLTWSIILILSLFDLILTFWQPFSGSSLGLWWLGEPSLKLGNPAVAKVFLFGEPILRGYGFFLHPNINALFLLCVIWILINVPRGTF
ncbi:MAG: hypothetical protein WDN67_02440 [Candidatus Moraniibacteriota bacterium]